jgi:murein L,D-transpeptidase YafK
VNELEIWARNDDSSTFKLVKTMRVCALSGQLGPKRKKGDEQVPEGFYFITRFNPVSEYHLSLEVGYPNYADRKSIEQQNAGGSWKADPGGDIYIHGDCVTIGCLPLTDEGIKLLYTLCLAARSNGQEYIPIHLFPARFTRGGIMYLKRTYENEPAKLKFWTELKGQYDYFEKNHKLLPVMYTPDGHYTY